MTIGLDYKSSEAAPKKTTGRSPAYALGCLSLLSMMVFIVCFLKLMVSETHLDDVPGEINISGSDVLEMLACLLTLPCTFFAALGGILIRKRGDRLTKWLCIFGLLFPPVFVYANFDGVFARLVDEKRAEIGMPRLNRGYNPRPAPLR